MVTPISFTSFKEPQLYCIVCEKSKRHCSHIQQEFKKNTDLDFMWEEDPALQFPISVEIPISSDYDQWAEVEIFSAKETIGLPGKALIRWEQIDLTVIGRGEGRRVIRDALVNHMLGDYKGTKECKSTGHTPRDQIEWLRDTGVDPSYPTRRVAQLWSVYTTGLCLGCNYRLNHLIREEAHTAALQVGKNIWNV